MEPTAAAGNLLEIMDLARTLRQEQLFIQHEQAAFAQLTGALETNAATITKLAYICAQQRQNLHDLLLTRTDHDPFACCRRASAYDNAPFLDAKQVLPYEHALAYEDLFNYLYNTPYLLAMSLATADRLSLVSPLQLEQVVHTIATGLYGNAINTKDVELLLKLLRELIEMQLLSSEQPRRLLRTNGSAFARLYQRLVESLFSARIFLTAALHAPLMAVLSEHEALLDVDPHKLLQSFTARERQRRFGEDETSANYQRNVVRFHAETLGKLHAHAQAFVRSLQQSWSLFPSSLRWLLQTLGQQLRQTQRHSDHEIRQLLSDLVFTHFICPAIVSADLLGIIDVNVSEQMRHNLNQIVQLLQRLALSDEASELAQLMEMLLVGQTGEDVVAILPQQSDFERAQLAINQRELQHFVDFFRLLVPRAEYEVSAEQRQRLQRILSRIPKTEVVTVVNAMQPPADAATEKSTTNGAKRSNKALMRLGKATKKKLAKGMSFSSGTSNSNSSHANSNSNSNSSSNANANASSHAQELGNGNAVSSNGAITNGDLEQCSSSHSGSNTSLSSCGATAAAATAASAPAAANAAPEVDVVDGNEPVLMFSIYNAAAKCKLKPLTEEDLLKMNCIGQEIAPAAVATAAPSSNADDASSMEAMRRPHDDASIGNSDNLEAISEAAHSANHSVASSLDLEEQQERDVHDAENDDNLSDMVSANVSGRGTPNISGRDTPSSQVTDGDGAAGELAHHVPRPTPQMQNMLLSKVRSDIEDKFCKFELKKFEGDENVSIISDTWSTDVLASDSENTLDASSEQQRERERDRERERERERNFSTPLIPSAVVLPGDNNNFVVEALARAAAPVLDASDQRSESNWSTDVLASDSEKLAEIDTDDNVSITAKSDTTAPLALAVVLDDGEQTPGSSGDGDADADGDGNGNASPSERSQEDSAFFDAVNSYDDAHHYQAASSLARSSVRTSYHGLGGDSGDSSFQQQYKCSAAEGRKSTPLMGTACMRRQTSAESSISNQSLNLEEPQTSKQQSQTHHHHHHHHHHHKKKKQQQQSLHVASNQRDLIDFSDYSEDKDDPPGLVQQLLDKFGDEQQLQQHQQPQHHPRGLGVEHRRISMEQRTASIDGRRNGILAGSDSARRHQSLNYENHEIMLQNMLPAERPKTDDDKQQELQLLCAQTQQLQLHHDDAATAATTAGKPSKATGAIPKSISFDASADKDKHRGQRESRDQSGSILNKLKQGIFKTRRSNNSNSSNNGNGNSKSASSSSSSAAAAAAAAASAASSNQRLSINNDQSRSVSFDPSTGACVNYGSEHTHNHSHYCDSSEDILAKYRRKVSSSSDATNSDSTGNGHGHGHGQSHSHSHGHAHNLPSGSAHGQVTNGGQLPGVVFSSVKQKLRTVLSKTDLHSGDFRQTTLRPLDATPLQTYLQIQLAQCISLQRLPQISHVAEAMRCLAQLERPQHAQLLLELQHDLERRKSYLQYLLVHRQQLLLHSEQLDQLEKRLRGEARSCQRCMLQSLVRLYLGRQQSKLQDFQAEFALLSVSDERLELIEEFVEGLLEELHDGGLQDEFQREAARAAIERLLLEQMYEQVMFPNEDADVSRDEVLAAHIGKLQRFVHPAHPALCIAQEYLGEAPWTFAQQQLCHMAAYKTPREKLHCIINCISSIMSLLRMSSGRVPAADDVLPVLIYVVIMANPPYLLSTVEYISCFLGKRLDGEDEFYWTLFGSVVKFIKTMDYLD